MFAIYRKTIIESQNDPITNIVGIKPEIALLLTDKGVIKPQENTIALILASAYPSR